MRSKHPENERILLARLTPAGRRILARSRTVIGDIYDTMLEGLSPGEVRELQGLLSRCATSLESSRPAAQQPR